uniref:Uncharacterized protein n=1 Tax=Craspedostauros australis TaxID=1486917 RepID=A0A6T6GKR3_9STRA
METVAGTYGMIDRTVFGLVRTLPSLVVVVVGCADLVASATAGSSGGGNTNAPTNQALSDSTMDIGHRKLISFVFFERMEIPTFVLSVFHDTRSTLGLSR